MMYPAPIATAFAAGDMLTLSWHRYFIDLTGALKQAGKTMYPAPLSTPIVDSQGMLTLPWKRYFMDLTTKLNLV